MFLSRRVFLVALGALGLFGCRRSESRIVLYCSQDREFALDVLETFRESTGLEVVTKFDTEKNKSVGLYTELVAEKDRPRCDVFWNNEIVSTIRLQRQGLLQPYESESATDYPAWAKADDLTWHAFASRARVLIVNTDRAKEVPASLLDLADPRWKGEPVMARPQFGTTATQIACLFEVLGKEKAEDYLRRLKANDIQLAPGNKQVAEWVARGKTPSGKPVSVGVTDTDDAIDEVKAGRPVRIIFPDRAGGYGQMGTLFIPNTLCIPKGCPNPEGAKKLVDYLLSAEVEKRLAEGPSAQIPLNPKVTATLPPQIETPASLTVMRVDWAKAADLWDDAQTFVTNLFAG
jgi:iron(III) transport system substrate-binding protein